MKAPYNSCANPGYNTIQQAVEATVSTPVVHVCANTYTEQVVITKPVSVIAEAGTKLVLPAAPAHSSGACTSAAEEETLLEVCGAGTVKVSNLAIEGAWEEEVCNDQLYDVFVGDGANLALSNSSVTHAGGNPQKDGCQGGVGIQIGDGEISSVGKATLNGDEVSSYQKNGITVDGAGSSATIKGGTVTTSPTAALAQNGIQVSDGATGKISSVTVSGNECNHPSCGEESLTQYQSTGIGFFFSHSGSSVTKSTLSGNDIGVYNLSEAETTRPSTTINSDTFENNRDESVVLDQGYANVSKDKIKGAGNVGIQLIQYEGQEFGPRGKGSGDEISGMTRYAIEGLSDLAAGDQFGSFTITSSAISNNPAGASVAGSVHTNNPSKLVIVTNASDS